MAHSLDELRSVLDYDPQTGLFRWKVMRGKARPGAVAGTSSNGYVQIGWGRLLYKAQRLAWLFTYGEWPKGDVDHIDCDPSNNRIANLRDVPHMENIQNQRRAHCDSETKLLGAHRNNGRFSARIMVDGRSIYIGTFATAEQAHTAYVKAKRELHGGCTL